MRDRLYKTFGIILKRRDAGEGSVISILSPELGKIRAIARGTGKPQSKKTGHLEVLNISSFPLL